MKASTFRKWLLCVRIDHIICEILYSYQCIISVVLFRLRSHTFNYTFRGQQRPDRVSCSPASIRLCSLIITWKRTWYRVIIRSGITLRGHFVHPFYHLEQPSLPLNETIRVGTNRRWMSPCCRIVESLFVWWLTFLSDMVIGDNELSLRGFRALSVILYLSSNHLCRPDEEFRAIAPPATACLFPSFSSTPKRF